MPPAACGIFVSGRARALTGELRGFDVAIVIDTSLSTIEPTGADVNGNGIVGSPYLGPVGSLFDAAGDDPGDSILAAEVAAARRLLRELDPRSTRVALITFAGEMEPVPSRFFFSRSAAPPATTREPLTREFARIERALDDLLASEPDGVTHMAAGVDQATRELLGQPGARSAPDPRSEKVVLFLTDGQPTLPYGPGKDAENVRAVLDAAERARQGAVRVHTFAIGPEALAGPIATVELAARTHGYFIPVRDPGDLVDVVEAVRLPDLNDVAVRSLTTGEPAHPFRADGGRVLQRPGRGRAGREPDRDHRARGRRNRRPARDRGDARPGRRCAGDPRRAGRRAQRAARGMSSGDARPAAAGRARAGRARPPGAAGRDRARAREGQRPRRRAAQAAPPGGQLSVRPRA